MSNQPQPLGYPAPGQTGYPPQGYPPQGYPPQGYPPQGYPPQGAPPQGYPPQGYPPQGYPPQGAPPQGYPPQGYPPQGYPPQGAPPQGYPPQQSYPPQGAPPQGYPPQGYPPQGYPPQGYPPQQSYPPQGAPPQGYPPQGYPAPGSFTTQQPPQQLSASLPLNLQSATYGTDQAPSTNNVLESLTRLRRGPNNVTVPGNMNATVGYDPNPGVRKVTVVNGNYGGVSVVIRVTEGVEYNFNLGTAPTGVNAEIVDAWYGTAERPSRDGVLQAVRSWKRGPSTLFVPANKNNALGRDPLPGVPKTLYIRVVTKPDTSVDFYIPEPQEITLNF